MTAEHDPTPMGVPVAAGDCPACGAFLAIRLRDRPPALRGIAAPAGPDAPVAVCPGCHAPLWLSLSLKAPVALPHGDGSALVPKTGAAQATTRRQDERKY